MSDETIKDETIKEAKRQGVHKQGDYPRSMAFDWLAEEA